MHIFIKVPPHIATVLGLTSLKNAKLPDGNYVAMIKQFERLCPAYRILEEAPKMGCAILRPFQLHAEREGKLITPLPEPTEEYKTPTPQTEVQPSEEENPRAEVQPSEEENPLAEPVEDAEEGDDITEDTEEDQNDNDIEAEESAEEGGDE